MNSVAASESWANVRQNNISATLLFNILCAAHQEILSSPSSLPTKTHPSTGQHFSPDYNNHKGPLTSHLLLHHSFGGGSIIAVALHALEITGAAHSTTHVQFHLQFWVAERRVGWRKGGQGGRRRQGHHLDSTDMSGTAERHHGTRSTAAAAATTQHLLVVVQRRDSFPDVLGLRRSDRLVGAKVKAPSARRVQHMFLQLRLNDTAKGRD